jgi:hypothetical protein
MSYRLDGPARSRDLSLLYSSEALLYNGYCQPLSSEVKGWIVKLTTHFHLVPIFIINVHMPSWRGTELIKQRDKSNFIFAITLLVVHNFTF